MPTQTRSADTVLIIIDLVQDYFDSDIWPNSRIPAARQRLVANTNELVAIFRESRLPVIWFRQEFLPDLSDAFLHMKRSGKRYATEGTPGCELLSDLHVAPGDLVLVKKRYSAFYGTELDTVLERMQVQTTVLAGITTAWCVRSTAVDAYQRDYDVVVAKECVEGFTEEDHKESLTALEALFGRCLSNSEIAGFLSQKRPKI